MMDFKGYLAEKKDLVDKALRSAMPVPEGPEGDLIKAMEYSLFAGGKRLRPILCIAGAEAVGGKAENVMPVACALEMIHTYSLIHDDLPAMDNDDMRRGKPTCHKVFGEAIAILAGDGLLTEAFHLMGELAFTNDISSEIYGEVVTLISKAAGFRGMVGGQAVDIRMEGKEIDSSVINYIHTHKTGALIKASVLSGAALGRGSARQLDAIASYGEKIGLAFQISDDILNIEGDSKEMGKSVGSDAERGKNTYPSIYGLEKSKELLNELVEDAVASLTIYNTKADPLRRIARYILERRK